MSPQAAVKTQHCCDTSTQPAQEYNDGMVTGQQLVLDGRFLSACAPCRGGRGRQGGARGPLPLALVRRGPHPGLTAAGSDPPPASAAAPEQQWCNVTNLEALHNEYMVHSRLRGQLAVVLHQLQQQLLRQQQINHARRGLKYRLVTALLIAVHSIAVSLPKHTGKRQRRCARFEPHFAHSRARTGFCWVPTRKMGAGSTLGPETKSSSSSPRSATTSTVRASPVLCSPMTQQRPSATASLASRTSAGTCGFGATPRVSFSHQPCSGTADWRTGVTEIRSHEAHGCELQLH